MSPLESTRRLLRSFSMGSSALTGNADVFDHPPQPNSEGHFACSVELEPWPTKPRHSEDSDLASPPPPPPSSSSAVASSAQASGAFADRLAELPSNQLRQRFPAHSIRSGISRSGSVSSNASSIISTRSSDAVASCSRRAQRRASEEAWRQFWD